MTAKWVSFTMIILAAVFLVAGMVIQATGHSGGALYLLSCYCSCISALISAGWLPIGGRSDEQ